MIIQKKEDSILIQFEINRKHYRLYVTPFAINLTIDLLISEIRNEEWYIENLIVFSKIYIEKNNKTTQLFWENPPYFPYFPNPEVSKIINYAIEKIIYKKEGPFYQLWQYIKNEAIKKKIKKKLQSMSV